MLTDLLARIGLVPAGRFASVEALVAAAPGLDDGVVLFTSHIARTYDPAVAAAARPLRSRFVSVMIVDPGDVAHAVTAVKGGAFDALELPVTGARLQAMIDAAFAELARRQADGVQTAEARTRMARLTPREREVLAALMQGGTNKTIAQRLDLSPRTVEIHRANLMERLGAQSLSDALRIAWAAAER